MKGWMLCGIVAAVAALGACGSDSGRLLGVDPAASRGQSGGGTDTSGTSGQTSNGPVVSITMFPANLVLPLGSYGEIVADARDAAGVRVNKNGTWRSSNDAVATVGDTGVVFGKALGSATVYVTIDGHTDSANVMVVPAPPPPPPPPAPVTEFNLTVVANGALPGADTSRVERVAGATVTLERRGGISGDTLQTPEPAGSAVTDANGQAVFKKLVGGTYSIRVTPPAGSPYAETTSGFAPPRQSDITVPVTLRRP